VSTDDPPKNVTLSTSSSIQKWLKSLRLVIWMLVIRARGTPTAHHTAMTETMDVGMPLVANRSPRMKSVILLRTHRAPASRSAMEAVVASHSLPK
jgi:hypothetical protein